jgi:predicted HTH transcriptional regulator
LDREISAWHESEVFEKPADYLKFIPFKKKEEFTSAMLAGHAGIDRWTAGKALYVLTKLKVVKRIGKKGNSWVYVKG